MSDKKLAIVQNEYRIILFIPDFLKRYNFTKYEIEDTLEKSKKIIYDYEVSVFLNKTNSKYIINGVFDVLRILYNDNQNEGVLETKYLIREFLRKVISDIFAQNIDFSNYLYIIAIIDPDFFLGIVEYKLNNSEGRDEIYNFFAFSEKNYFSDNKRLYFNLLSFFEHLGEHKNYFLRVLKILFKIYNIIQNLDYKNIANTPLNSIISIFANFYCYNIDGAKNCIDVMNEFFEINSNNVYMLVYELICDKIFWNECYYDSISINSIKLPKDKDFFKYCMGKCFESVEKNQPKYWINLLHLIRYCNRETYNNFIELLAKNNFDNWTLEEKIDFKREIKQYLDAYDSGYKLWFGEDYLKWNFEKLKRFYSGFKIGGINDYVFYFKNVKMLDFNKDFTIETDCIRKIDDFIDRYSVNGIIELLSKNISKDYFYINIITKALIQSKANFENIIQILFNNNYYDELQQYLIGLIESKKNVFEESYLLLNKSNLFVEKVLTNLFYKNELKNFLEKYNLTNIYWTNAKLEIVPKEYLDLYIDNYKKYNNSYFINLCINMCTDIGDLDLILDTLSNIADYINKKYSDKKDSNNLVIDEYCINTMLNKIYNNFKFYTDNFDKILDIEIILYDFISNDSNNYQTPKTLELKIKDDPEYLLKLMSFYYLPERITEEETKKINSENKKYKTAYTKIFFILNYLRFIPSGVWCENILELYNKNNYKFNKFFIYSIIGQILSDSPIDENDGIYPNKQARDIIEKYYSEAQDFDKNTNWLLSSFLTAKFNSRGVVLSTDGKAEKELSHKYKKYREQLEELYLGKYNGTILILKDLEKNI